MHFISTVAVAAATFATAVSATNYSVIVGQNSANIYEPTQYAPNLSILPAQLSDSHPPTDSPAFKAETLSRSSCKSLNTL